MSEWISVEDRLPKKYNHKRTVNVLMWIPEQPNSPIVIGYGLMNDGVNYEGLSKDRMGARKDRFQNWIIDK